MKLQGNTDERGGQGEINYQGLLSIDSFHSASWTSPVLVFFCVFFSEKNSLKLSKLWRQKILKNLFPLYQLDSTNWTILVLCVCLFLSFGVCFLSFQTVQIVNKILKNLLPLCKLDSTSWVTLVEPVQQFHLCGICQWKTIESESIFCLCF